MTSFWTLGELLIFKHILFMVFFIFMSMNIFPSGMSVHHTWTWCPPKSQEGTGSTGTEVVVIGNYMWVSGTKPRYTSALNH